MPITVFHAVSDRIHDINLDDGKTVGELKEILRGAGYDVADALTTINRFAEQDKLIGRNNAYVLKEGDTVEFKTLSVAIPALEKDIAMRIKAAAERANVSFEGADAATVKCSQCCHKDSNACAKQHEQKCVAVNGIEVTPTENGIIIRIAR